MEVGIDWWVDVWIGRYRDRGCVYVWSDELIKLWVQASKVTASI